MEFGPKPPVINSKETPTATEQGGMQRIHQEIVELQDTFDTSAAALALVDITSIDIAKNAGMMGGIDVEKNRGALTEISTSIDRVFRKIQEVRKGFEMGSGSTWSADLSLPDSSKIKKALEGTGKLSADDLYSIARNARQTSQVMKFIRGIMHGISRSAQ